MGQRISICESPDCQQQYSEPRCLNCKPCQPKRRYCTHHQCQYSTWACYNARTPMSLFCYLHQCSLENCLNEKRYKVAGVCYHHLCPYCRINKKLIKEPSCQDCQETRKFCAIAGCDKSIIKKYYESPPEEYACSEHRCHFCTLPKAPNSSCCVHHTCKNPDCNLIAELRDGYCPKHIKSKTPN